MRKVILLVVLGILCQLTVWAGEARNSSQSAVKTRKDTPTDFNRFLEACSQPERRSLLNAMGKETKEGEYITPERIKKEFVWAESNILTYYFKGSEQVDYHGILRWTAGKFDVSKNEINALSTFELEKSIIRRYLGTLWDELPTEKRIDALLEIKKIKENIDTAQIVAMSGDDAVKSLISTDARFYSNATLLFMYSVGEREPSFIKSISGKSIAAGAAAILGGSATLFAGVVGSANERKTAYFAMIMHGIKVSRYGE